jgi:hypothetical protein
MLRCFGITTLFLGISLSARFGVPEKLSNSSQLPAGFLAITVSVPEDDDNKVLLPKSLVDVLGTKGTEGEAASVKLLENGLLLAVDRQSASKRDADEKDSSAKWDTLIFTIAVTPRQAQQLTPDVVQGEMRVVFHSKKRH